MLQKLIYRVLRHRHFWRHSSFDELSQLYISSFFRLLAFSLVGIFIPIFLYGLGYSLALIFWFYIAYAIAQTLLHIPFAFVVARIGPKHTILLSFVLQFLASIAFLTLPNVAWPLWFLALLWAAATSLFFTAYHVDFSKVKHSEHGGKEMGIASIVQNIGGAAGPIVGGIIATIFGSQYIFLVMALLLAVGIVPLFTSAEPVRTKQKISLRKLPLASIKRDLVSYSGLITAHQLSITLWPLYLGIFALGANVYLELGALSSIGFVVSIFTAYAIGKLIDNKRGHELLRFSSIVDVFIQLSKPFVAAFPFALVVNTAGETTGVAKRIAYQKGMYDAADDLPGNRIVYITFLETTGAIVKTIIWLLLLGIGLVVSFEAAIVVGFVIAALANLFTMAERFKGL